MRKGLLLVPAVWLAVAGFAAAQCPGPRLYGNVDYLLFWIKDGPNPTPLLSTAPPGGIPVLGAPGAHALFGGQPMSYGTFSGIRATVGAWRDCEATLGLEGSGFLLERRGTGFASRSNEPGMPPLALPAFDPSSANTTAFPLADPSFGLTGGAAIASRTRLWGAEANVAVNLIRDEALTLDGLVGFRYLDLGEDLRVIADNTFTSPIPFLPGSVGVSLFDRFAGRNQFYGGQVGGRMRWQFDDVSVSLLGKVALGDSRQVVLITGGADGVTTGVFTGVPVVLAPGGFYTQASNLGKRISNTLAVVPEVQAEIAYDLTDWLRFSVGYNFLYWSSVVRPGAQIDPNVNVTRSAVPFDLPPAGPIAPQPRFNKDDFFVHGVNFSLAFSF